MRKIRVAAAATTLSLVGAVSSLGAAGAAPSGVGTSEASTTVLGIALGDGKLLNLRLLGDLARSTTDAKVNPVSEAFATLSALDVGSSVAALNKSVPETPFETRSPGGKASDGIPGTNLGSALPLGVLSGVLDVANLTSLVDANGATSALNSAVGDISAVGGLLSLKGLTSNLTTSSKAEASAGTRSVKLESANVLDLGAVLNGLGIDLLDLAPRQLTGLLGGLDLDVANLGDAAAVDALVDSLQGQITGLLATVTSITTPLTGTAINTVVGSLPIGGLIPVATVTDLAGMTDPAAQVNALVDELQNVLGDVLSSVLGTLDTASLLSLGASEFGVVTKASDTVAGSVADVTGRLGALSVGGLSIPGLDVGATAAQVTGLLNTVNGAIGSVLGAVDPGLSGLVKVKALDKDASVTTEAGYTKSKASVTGLTASILPPSNLLGIVTGIANQAGAGTSAGSLIPASSRSALPVLDGAMGGLGGVLGVVDALTGGLTVTVGQLLGTSEFTATAVPGTPNNPAAPVASPTGDLPRTGQNGLQLAAIGALFVALGLGFRYWMSMPSLD